MNSGNYTGPRVPVRPAPPPPVTNKQAQLDTQPTQKRGNLSLSKLLPSISRKTDDSRKTASTKKVPPPRPPPPKLPPKKQIVDLLSGSPPSSPSPTLRSQESGFEEDPELWRGWPDSSRSTPLLDWPQESEWPSQPSAHCWTPQWRSETTTPTTSVTPAAPPAVAHSASMPTIIRSKPSKQFTKKEEVSGDESPPMPNFPPPLPPANLDDDLIVTSYPTAPMPWKAVALYDFPASHPDDLPLKVGDQLEILSQVDENWFQGRVEWNTGNFPACFVHILQ